MVNLYTILSFEDVHYYMQEETHQTFILYTRRDDGKCMTNSNVNEIYKREILFLYIFCIPLSHVFARVLSNIENYTSIFFLNKILESRDSYLRNILLKVFFATIKFCNVLAQQRICCSYTKFLRNSLYYF